MDLIRLHTVAVAAAVSCATCAWSQCVGPSFQDVRYNVEKDAADIVTGDVDGDGFEDYVIVGDDVTVFRTASTSIPVFRSERPLDGRSQRAALAQFDNDGSIDLVFSKVFQGDRVLEVLFNNGTGSFRSPVRLPLPDDTRGLGLITAGDFNGDGIADIATAIDDTDSVRVFLSNGDRTFQPPTSLVVGGQSIGLANADLNNDDRPDLIVSNRQPRALRVFLNAGGSFGAPTLYEPEDPFDGIYGEVSTADFNGDGFPDVLIGSSGLIFANRADGTGDLEAPAPIHVRGSDNGDFRVADYNSDGLPDLGILQENAQFSTRLNTGVGFSFEPAVTTPVDSRTFGLATGDFNGDGATDIVTFTSRTDAIGIMLIGAGDGSFERESAIGVGLGPRGVDIGDLDGDGDLDVVTVDVGDDAITVLENTGGAAFFDDRVTPVGNEPTSIVLADLDLDTDLDAVVTNEFSDTVTLLFNNGGAFWTRTATFPAGNSPVASAIGDLNGDHLPDIVIANGFGSAFNLLLNQGARVFALQPEVPTGQQTIDVALEDLDGDNDLDVVTANRRDDALNVHRNNGDATFAPRQVIPVSARPSSVAVGHLDDDGFPDLVAASSAAGGGIDVLLSNGPTGYQFRVNYPIPEFQRMGSPSDLLLEDVNRDGSLDLVCAVDSDLLVIIYTNLGDGTFAPGYATQARARNGLAAIATGDLNGDNAPDLVITDSESGTITLLANLCGDDLGCPGDADGNGQTDTADITFVVSNLGAGSPGAMGTPGDVNRNGVTNVADITFVVSNLGSSCEPL